MVSEVRLKSPDSGAMGTVGGCEQGGVGSPLAM